MVDWLFADHTIILDGQLPLLGACRFVPAGLCLPVCTLSPSYHHVQALPDTGSGQIACILFHL
jgi:hypothetical protein